MKIVHRTAIVLLLISATGCTLRPYFRDPGDPALSAMQPCASGEICGVPLAGFSWAADAMHSTRL